MHFLISETFKRGDLDSDGFLTRKEQLNYFISAYEAAVSIYSWRDLSMEIITVNLVHVKREREIFMKSKTCKF